MMQRAIKLYLIVSLALLLLQATTTNAHRITGSSLKSAECGVEGKYIPREDHGKPVQPHEYPWIALVGNAVGTVFTIKSVGALITSKYVLSSAQVMEDVPISKIPTHVRLGEYDIRTQSRGQPLPADYYIVSHKTPDYIKITKENDIALLLLDRDVIFTETIRPACLPFGFENVNFAENKLFTVGFSRHSPYENHRKDRSSTVPLGAMMLTGGLQDCIDTFSTSDQSITEKNMCFKGRDSETCPSMSDGPLHYYDGVTGKYVVLSIMTSIPDQCPDLLKPYSVATKISKFLPWIESNID